MLTQTWAIFYDAYRRLNARKLFWTVLGLSGLVVAALAGVSINERGVSVFVWQFDSEVVNSRVIPAESFYVWMFTELGFGWWLSWLGVVLALVSTAGVFPDFLAEGAVDVVLAKPIGRWRLFATQYAGGLMFVLLQVSLFSGASFLAIGLRGGAWEAGLFWAVPAVTLMFSYLFAVCALWGVLTRSAMASLLLTLLFWAGLFGVRATELVLVQQTVRFERRAARVDPILEDYRAELAYREAREAGEPADPPEPRKHDDLTEEQIAYQIGLLVDRREDRMQSVRTLEPWVEGFSAARRFLPKPAETVELVQYSLVSPEHVPAGERGRRMDREIRRRVDPGNVLGTSLAFEVAVLLAAGWIFSRRDY